METILIWHEGYFLATYTTAKTDFNQPYRISSYLHLWSSKNMNFSHWLQYYFMSFKEISPECTTPGCYQKHLFVFIQIKLCGNYVTYGVHYSSLCICEIKIWCLPTNIIWCYVELKFTFRIVCEISSKFHKTFLSTLIEIVHRSLQWWSICWGCDLTLCFSQNSIYL